MWPFKKKEKKIYFIEWAYNSQTPITYKEIIKADDITDAWMQIKSEHGISICLRSIQECEE